MNGYKAPGTVASTFTRHLGVVGMYKDNSLSAATRAKELEKIREAKEKQRAIEAHELLKLKDIEERELLAFSLKRKLRNLKRKQRKEEALAKFYAAVFIQRIWRDYSEWKLQCFENILFESCKTIQKSVRNWLSRRRVEEILIENRNTKAVVIQKLVRGYIIRIQRSRRILFRENAVTDIQRIFRGYFGRRKAKHQNAHRVAGTIQCHLRMFFAFNLRKRLEKETLEREQEEAEIELMAVEDELCMVIEIAERRMRQEKKEKEEQTIKLKVAQRDKAKREGIPLLPWRRKTISLADIVELQKQRRKEQERIKIEQERQKEIEESKARIYRLKILEEERKHRLKEYKSRSKKEEAERKKLEELKAEEDEIQREQKELKAKKRREEENRKRQQRRAAILKNSQEKLERQREESEREADRIREAEEKRLMHLRRMEEIRLFEIRQKAAEKREQNKLDELLEAEKRREEESLQRALMEQNLESQKIKRQEIHRRWKRRKELERKKAIELEQQLEKEAQEKRELLNRKAVALRRKIRKRLSKEQAQAQLQSRRHEKNTFRNSKKGGRRITKVSNPGISKKTLNSYSLSKMSLKSKVPKTKSKDKSMVLYKPQNNQESIEDIFQRAEVLLLPKLNPRKYEQMQEAESSIFKVDIDPKYALPSAPKTRVAKTKKKSKGKTKLKTGSTDNPLARALQWKMEQMTQEEDFLSELSISEKSAFDLDDADSATLEVIPQPENENDNFCTFVTDNEDENPYEDDFDDDIYSDAETRTE